MEANVICCTTWVKKGVAAAVPEKVIFDDIVELRPDELEKIIKETQDALTLEGDDDDSDEEAVVSKVQPKTENRGESSTIKSDDNLILFGHVEGNASILEVFVYNEREGSFYCHHDILLPSFPLCIEWLNYDPTNPKPSNLCAIGSMSPIIEVWDLDLIDCLEPAYKLGRKPNELTNQSGFGHKDAVLDLSWNHNYRHVIASGSVDRTVLLWDLDNGIPVNELGPFNEKVQSLKFHPQDTHELLIGCADRVVKLYDCMNEIPITNWEALGEVERVLWNHYNKNHCIISTDNGYIEYFDIRKPKPLWQIKAHEKEVTGLSLSTTCPDLLVSCSNDHVIKIWDIDQKSPTLVWEQTSHLGALQCLAVNPDNGYLFSVGGDNKERNFKVLNLTKIPMVRERFVKRVAPKKSAESR